MNFSSSKRPLLLGLALAVAGAAGAAVAVTLAVASPSAPQTLPVVPAAQVLTAGSSPSIAVGADSGAPVVTSSAAPAVSAAPPVASTAPSVAPAATPTVISLDQARGIAERAANGQADQVQADTGPTGLTYDVPVTRSDGTDVEVIIDGHTGRIVSNVAEQQDPQDSNTPDPQDTPDTQDGAN
jgi:Peptidase propeptide and YPEB domain